MNNIERRQIEEKLKNLRENRKTDIFCATGCGLCDILWIAMRAQDPSILKSLLVIINSYLVGHYVLDGINTQNKIDDEVNKLILER